MEGVWDADDWLKRLSAALEIAGNGYLRMPLEDDEATAATTWPARPGNRTIFAAMTIGALNNALMELPGMANHVGLAVLHDVIAALMDLGHGGRPPLLEPVKGVGKGVEASGRRIVRQHAIAFVGLLEKVGTRPTPACHEVAQVLAKAGHKGMKGEPLSGETVKGWWNATRRKGYCDRDPRGAAAYRRFFEHLERRPDWPFSAESARQYIQEVVASPAMRSKVG